MAIDDDDDNKTTPFIRDEDPAQPAPAVSPSAGPSPVVEVQTQLSPSMFNNYDRARKQKAPKWAAPLLVAVLVGHGGVALAAYIKTIWEIEMLDRPTTKVELALAPMPPPAAPPPPGGPKQQTQTLTPKKKTVKDIVQPIKIEKQEQKPVESSGSDSNVESDEYCDPATEVCGTGPGVKGGADIEAPPPPPPPPPPPAPPQNVPPTLLEGQRVAGDKIIIPDDVTKTEIMRSGKTQIIGSFKICLDATGRVTQVTQLKSTGFPAYDNKILGKMRGEWKYKPYAVNGRAVPVCTAVTFIYRQK